MKTTVFIDITNGKYNEISNYQFEINCMRGDYVDFSHYEAFGDDDVFEIIDIVYLPNERKKIVEVRQTHTDSFKRDRRDGYTENR